MRATPKTSSPITHQGQSAVMGDPARAFEWQMAYHRGQRGPGRCSPEEHAEPSWEACWRIDDWFLGCRLEDSREQFHQSRIDRDTKLAVEGGLSWSGGAWQKIS